MGCSVCSEGFLSGEVHRSRHGELSEPYAIQAQLLEDTNMDNPNFTAASNQAKPARYAPLQDGPVDLQEEVP